MSAVVLAMVGGPEVKKCEQLSSLGHQTELLGHYMGAGAPCMVRSNESWVMVTWDPPFEQTDMTETLSSCNFTGDQ